MHTTGPRAILAVIVLVSLLNGEGKAERCGEGRCVCDAIMADCSGRQGKHSYIPALPDGIYLLDFSDNCLTAIDNDDFFLNVTNIEFLNLNKNGLVSISVVALKSLKKLQHLIIDDNNLTPLSLVDIFSVSTLSDLSLERNLLDSLPEGIFYSHPMQELQRMSLRENKISKLNMTELLPLVQLKFLDLGFNRISDNIIPDYLPQLEKLQVISNGISTFPKTCTHNAFSLFPNLTSLFLYGNLLRTLPEHICLPSLDYINLGGNHISVLESGMFSQRRFPALQTVSLSSMQTGIQRIEEDAFSNPNLQSIDLSSHALAEGRMLIESDAFAGCPNLRDLDMSWVDFGDLNDHEIQLLFQHLGNLRTLILEFARIRLLTTSTFKSLKSLEVMSLDYNMITNLPDGVFDSLMNLRLLTLNHNQIATIRETTFSAATRRRLKGLQLMYNPFKCDCDLRWFQEFLRSDAGGLFWWPYSIYYECDRSQVDTNMDRMSKNTNKLRQHGGRLGVVADEIRIDEDGRRTDEDRAKDKDKIKVDTGRLLTRKGRVKRNTVGIRADTKGAGMNEYAIRNGYLRNPTSPTTMLIGGRFGGQRHEKRGSTASNRTDPTLVVSFYVPDQACLLSPETSRLIIISVSFPVVMLTSFLLLYSYRWHIRLLLYDAFRGKGDRQRRLQEQNFDYDVFVSYDSDDFDWVYHTLTPVLENDLGLRMCLHTRDFIPGKHILSNIVDCVESSKKIMAVFSTNFAKSPWCQFELTLCLNHVMEHDDALLIVMLHDIPPRDLTSAMMAVMKTTTYIQWAEEPDATASFWGRVRIALNEIIPDV